MKEADEKLYAYMLDHLLEDIQLDRQVLETVFRGVDYVGYMKTFVEAAKRYLLRFESLLPDIKSVYMQREFTGTGIRAEQWEPGDDEYYAREEPQLVISFGPLGEWKEDVSLVIRQRYRKNSEEGTTRLLDQGLIVVRGEKQDGSWVQQLIVMEDYLVKEGEHKGKVWKALDELIRAGERFGFPINAHDVAAFVSRNGSHFEKL
jgi:hypothetical protein